MSAVVILDASPLGLLANPRSLPLTVAVRRWLVDLRAAGRRVVVPEITDYEVRRECLRISSTRGIANLDKLTQHLEYLPLNTAAMRRAAELWALVSQKGRPTAGAGALDADVILTAQALTLNAPSLVIATANVGHLSRFATAELWQNIKP